MNNPTDTSGTSSTSGRQDANKSLAEVKEMVEEFMEVYVVPNRLSITMLESKEKVYENFPLLAQTLLDLIEDNKLMREKIDWAIGKCHEQDAGFQWKIINGLEDCLSNSQNDL